MDNAGGQATGNNGAGKDSPNAGKAAPGSTVSLRRDSAAFGPLGHEDMANAVMAYLSASRMVRDGNAALEDDKQRHLRSIQNRYWRIFFSTLSSILANRQDEFEFTDEERLFLDIGLVDIRMISDGSNPRAAKAILDRVGEKGPAGCFHLSEWLSERYRQARIDGVPIPIDAETMSSDASSRLEETRRRVLARLGPLLTGLPGIPLEVSEAMRSGNLERNLLSINIAALENPRRKTLLHRHKLWKLRNQVLEKARARASGQEAVRLMELLDEIYAREWRERYDRFLHGAPPADRGKTPGAGNDEAAPKSNTDAVLDEARQIRMRMALMDAIEGKQSPDMALSGGEMILGKADLASFLPIVQTFDRSLSEIPSIIIVPGSGRGFFAWESGCIMLNLRPVASVEDSIATAFAWYRMLDDRFNQNGGLRKAYEKKFPGAVFGTDFPADYRAWLCHVVKGEAEAMNQQRRAFFRDFIGPDISGPLLPSNLRNVGPQTLEAISRRLEKQISSGDKDVNLYRRLAAIYWQQGNVQAAGLQYTAAMGLAPNDGETLFAAGMFMRSNGDIEAANDCFRYGRERAEESLWGIYCLDALDNQF